MRQYQIVRGLSEGYGQDRLSPGIFRLPHFAMLRQVKGRSSAVSRRSGYGKCLGPEERIYGREFPLPSLMFSDRFFTLGTNLDGSLPFGDDRPVSTLQTRRSTPRLHPSPPRLNFPLLLSIPFGNITNRCTRFRRSARRLLGALEVRQTPVRPSKRVSSIVRFISS